MKIGFIPSARKRLTHSPQRRGNIEHRTLNSEHRTTLTPTLSHPMGEAEEAEGRRWVRGKGRGSAQTNTCCFIITILFLAMSAGAADKLQADLTPLVLRARNDAPIPIEVRFKWSGTRILEGRLQLELHDGNRVLERYRSGDLALTGGEQTFHMLLPPSLAPFSDSQVEAQMKFITAKETFDLDSSSVFLPTASQRSLVMGWCNPRFAAAGQVSDLEQSLVFERFAPMSSEWARGSILTSLLRLAPEDLPTQPLAYTSYDVMVLTSEAFAEAREGQLKALLRWVKAGGSVCVFAGGGLQPHHLSFLNQLADSFTDGPAFQSGSDGNLLPGQKKISCLYSGVGRSVVVIGNIGTDLPLTSPDWRHAAAFLWKFREQEMNAITQRGHWGTDTDESTNEPQATIDDYASQAQTFQRRIQRSRTSITIEAMDKALTLSDDEKDKVKAALRELDAAMRQIRNVAPAERRNKLLAAREAFDAKLKEILTSDQYNKFRAGYPNRFLARPAPRPQIINNPGVLMASPYESHASLLGAELLGPLMPRTVRLIPFPALLGILGLFLLVIGPADYFVLGWIRRRRYTWILFPATSIGFTLATVLMANHYLGLRDQRRSLIVVDMGNDGTALRWNQYELVFAARDKQAVTDLKDALWTPLNSGGMPYIVGNPRYGYARGYRDTDSETGPPWYEGVLPAHFQTSETLHQWQPKLNRIFSFEAPPAPLLANWREIEGAWPNLQNIRAKLSKTKPFTGDLCVISNSGDVSFDSGAVLRRPQAPAYPDGIAIDPATGQPYVRNYVGGFPGSDPNAILPSAILSQLCLGQSDGLLSLVSQISPAGGRGFEDVSALDPEAGDSALVIVTKVGDDIVVYRRFFHGN
jgi:hypothetical protein